jgi:hypothetical protein
MVVCVHVWQGALEFLSLLSRTQISSSSDMPCPCTFLNFDSPPRLASRQPRGRYPAQEMAFDGIWFRIVVVEYIGGGKARMTKLYADTE